MNIGEFWEYIQRINEESKGTIKKEIIREIISGNDDESWEATISFIAGEEFNNVGVAPRTMMKSIGQSELQYTVDEIEEMKVEHGTVTEALMTVYPYEEVSDSGIDRESLPLDSFMDETVEGSDSSFKPVSRLYKDCQRLHELSGNALQDKLSKMFTEYYPPAVSYAVLDDLSIGASKKTITTAIAEKEYTRTQIERARAFTPDVVEYVHCVLQDDKNLQLEPRSGSPFDPMAAKSKDPPENTEGWAAQLKLDGYRLLIHVKDGEATAFTRDRNDETHSLPELKQVDWPDGEFIFDCEAMAYSDSHGELPFNKTSQRIGRKHDLDKFDYEIRFYLFDILMSNGTDYTTIPQSERLEELESVAPTDNNYVTVIETDPDIDSLLQRAKDEAREGVIVKEMGVEYEFKRSSAWRKIKVTEHTIDLRIVDFERQQGSDSNTLGGVGVETKEGHFVGYVGTGFTDDLSKEIWENQDDYMGKVIEVQFEGFDEKLRFPSFKYFREDTEPDTLEKIKKLSPEV